MTYSNSNLHIFESGGKKMYPWMKNVSCLEKNGIEVGGDGGMEVGRIGGREGVRGISHWDMGI